MKENINHNFTATQWESAEQKEKFYNHFVKFVERDFPESLFYDWFYKRLSMTFGHIAHYNKFGFYGTFFTSNRNKVEFLFQTLNFPCYGDPQFTYSDVEKEIVKWLQANNILNKYRNTVSDEVEKMEREEYARLSLKYG